MLVVELIEGYLDSLNLVSVARSLAHHSRAYSIGVIEYAHV